MSRPAPYLHPAALVETGRIGGGTRVWAFAHILPGAEIGADCNICDHVFIENDVTIGDRVTIKCGVQIWDGVTIEDDVFIGPNAKVEALVNAATVIISGELVGDVVVTKRLELKSPGRLKGNITAPLVVMDEGVVFEGHCSMTTDQELDDNRGRITLLSAKG